MKASLTLENTAYTSAQQPLINEPQIALVGRSNVGKSSLLNTLGARRNLAKVSSTPGKTRSVNFFRVMPYNFYLVDLPGYGYARAGHQDREKWEQLLEDYLSRCEHLKSVLLLLDCRLPPQKNDLTLTCFARDLRLSFLPVLTKSDKCNRRERLARQKEWQSLLGQAPLLTSSVMRMGIDELWERLLATVGDACNAPVLDSATAETPASLESGRPGLS
ncbi:ribosome biogenesis GTP-binding protein YihA/YsxC [Candidatus Desulfovibrio trichonymphae]|uniref:ribosome biogenesis GTP-binding protein YihA/YsxC n=1 Tax=Candidatus Desulfovibrio trichonymphae TaxID=1725232 RepID=UPI000BBA5862|nr:ribosome biogenesis GTP-binding protein YihA/YsxC [Candidatus Desulfovibrio trichonymphae]